MHILFVSDGDSKYGASQSMKQLVKGMLEYYDDIEISVVLPLRVKLEDYYRQLGCHTYKVLYEPFYQDVPGDRWKLPIKFCIRGIEYLLGRWFAPYYLNKKINMDRIDIIHSNSSREDFGAALALKYKKPLIWHIREFGGDKDYKCFSFRKDYIKFMNKAASEFIAVSNAVKKHWIKKGLNEEKVVRVYNGIDIKINGKRKQKKREDKVLKLIMLGFICETKGQYQVIQALKLMTEKERAQIKIDFIGGGTTSYIKKLKKDIEENNLSNVVSFLGYYEDFQQEISRYDCGLMCSKLEGFGRVTVEYMLSGLPVIASNTGANIELVKDCVNGFLYEWNSIADLKDKLMLALHDKEALAKMGNIAKDYAETYFSMRTSLTSIYNEYLKMQEVFGKIYHKDI